MTPDVTDMAETETEVSVKMLPCPSSPKRFSSVSVTFLNRGPMTLGMP